MAFETFKEVFDANLTYVVELFSSFIENVQKVSIGLLRHKSYHIVGLEANSRCQLKAINVYRPNRNLQVSILHVNHLVIKSSLLLEFEDSQAVTFHAA